MGLTMARDRDTQQDQAPDSYSRREALKSVRKYAMVSGAAVVALSADGAVNRLAATTLTPSGNKLPDAAKPPQAPGTPGPKN